VIEFTLPAAVAGQKTSAQVKAPLKDVFMTYGPIDEIKVTGETDRKVQVVFVNRLLEKGNALKAALDKDDKDNKPSITVFDTKVEVRKVTGVVSSKGGAHSGTSHLKSTKPPKQSDRGRGRGRGEDGKDGKAGGRGGETRGGAAGRGAARGGAAGGKAGGKDDKKGGKDGKGKDDKKGDKKDDKKGGDKKDDKKKK